MRKTSLYLKDMLDAMTAIERFVTGIGYEEFRDDDKTSSAVIRKFEIIGEATKHITQEIRIKYPQIPWKEMAGFRDKLIHFYFGVNFELVWDTIKNVIPDVKLAIEAILRENESN
ncbi:MAG: DUF86 domain-containing protein [Nitrospirae bacterium]|nr:DUF86 domain-containing protein [Nitrospirota bacterium]